MVFRFYFYTFAPSNNKKDNYEKDSYITAADGSIRHC